MEGWNGRGKRAFLGFLSAFVFEMNTELFLTQKRKIGDVLVCENVECRYITNITK